jgi:hypothetical protein
MAKGNSTKTNNGSQNTTWKLKVAQSETHKKHPGAPEG